MVATRPEYHTGPPFGLHLPYPFVEQNRNTIQDSDNLAFAQARVASHRAGSVLPFFPNLPNQDSSVEMRKVCRLYDLRED